MVHLPLKWRDEDPVAFKDAFAPFVLFHEWKKRSINLFYWFACPKVETKAFLCIQEKKDEEEWQETDLHIDNYWYVEVRGMRMKIIIVF